MIAMKREVAAKGQVIPWSECPFKKPATSHCTIKQESAECGNNVCRYRTHTEKCTVTTVVLKCANKEATFFYGKSENENHLKGL